jgi:AcrR family transcriptional regulator
MTENTTSKRTQVERTRARKEQVIDAAIRFFGQNGFHGARLAEIAKAAGVTGPGLLHHYPSKELLLMDVLAERDRIDQARFDPAGPGESGGPLVSLQALEQYNQTLPGLVQLFTVLVAESIDEKHPGHAFFLQRYRDLRTRYIPLIEALQAKGEIRKEIPAEDLVILVFAVMDGLQIQWLYEPETIHMAQIFDQFSQLLKPA